jgi:hypothetical protein
MIEDPAVAIRIGTRNRAVAFSQRSTRTGGATVRESNAPATGGRGRMAVLPVMAVSWSSTAAAAQLTNVLLRPE